MITSCGNLSRESGNTCISVSIDYCYSECILLSLKTLEWGMDFLRLEGCYESSFRNMFVCWLGIHTSVKLAIIDIYIKFKNSMCCEEMSLVNLIVGCAMFRW